MNQARGTPAVPCLLFLLFVAVVPTPSWAQDLSQFLTGDGLQDYFSLRLTEDSQVTLPNGQVRECPYVSTPIAGENPQGLEWGCPQGYFCQCDPMMDSRCQVECPPAFYCPENTAQPLFCCPGFYCETPGQIAVCPKDHFCPIGTVEPETCAVWLSTCEVGSERPVRVLALIPITLAFSLIMLIFAIKRKNDSRRIAKYKMSMSNLHRNTAEDQRYWAAMNQAGAETADLAKSDGMGLSYGMLDGGGSSFYPTISKRETKTYDIEFSNLGLVLPNGVEIMRGVSGVLRAGRTMAVMGPSGAGKSTLFSLLTGKVKRTSGSIFINKRREELSKYKKLVGFVPQEDIMIRELTVRDILMHAAKMRLPKSWDFARKKQKVLETIDFLGLSHVMDSIIGNEEERGISGGQRKRVNIGMELVAEPSVLFLDEPTSGLDSSTAFEVCHQLKMIARQQGLTIAAVIHSPSPTAFQQFDDFLLLGKGGRIAYVGPRVHASVYFSQMGFICPSHQAESDFFMDVVSGKVPCSWNPDFCPHDLFLYWEKYKRGEPISIHDSIKVSEDSDKPLGMKGIGATCGHVWELMYDLSMWIVDVLREFVMFWVGMLLPDRVRSTPNAFVVFWLCFKRAMTQILRSRVSFIMDQVIHFGVGIFISLSVQSLDYVGVQPEQICATAPASLQIQCRTPSDWIRFIGIFVCLGTFYAGISAGSTTFGHERVVFWRDTASGMMTIPYFLAKLTADLLRIFLAAALFTLALVVFWPYRSTITALFAIVLLLYFVAFSIGYFISTIAKRENVTLMGTAMALAWALVFAGVVPSLEEVRNENSATNQFEIFWNISAPRYAVEALYIIETGGLAFQELRNNTLSFTYRQDNLANDHMYMLFIGLGWLGLAFLGLKTMHREKQR